MKSRMLGLALAAGMAAAPASAASLYVGHGIPGPDGLPVDICLVTPDATVPLYTGVTFGAFTPDPLELDAGRYDVEVRLSDGACGGTVAVAASVFLGLGENATAFAHLSEQGTPLAAPAPHDGRRITITAGHARRARARR